LVVEGMFGLRSCSMALTSNIIHKIARANPSKKAASTNQGHLYRRGGFSFGGSILILILTMIHLPGDHDLVNAQNPAEVPARENSTCGDFRLSSARPLVHEQP